MFIIIMTHSLYLAISLIINLTKMYALSDQ